MFEPGETEGHVYVSVVGDAVKEVNEVVALHFSDLKAAALPAGTDLYVNATIFDDESIVTAGVASIGEGDAATSSILHFPVTLSRPSTEPVVVHYQTLAGTAKAGADFQAVSDNLVFAPGQTFATVDITVFGDNIKEANETFTLQFDHPFGTGFSGAVPSIQVIGTIVDNEPTIIA